MVQFRFTLVLFLAVAIFLNCGDSDPVSCPVIATEQWRLNDQGTSSHADMTFAKNSNNAVTASGKWYYSFYGNLITCTFMSGNAIVADTTVSFTATGMAAYPPDSSGNVESSDFILTMTGAYKAGIASGNWEIHFADSLWEGWIDPGTFTGARQSGNGITTE